jgi:hypothetical protein
MVQTAETEAETLRLAEADPANAGIEIKLITARERIARFMFVAPFVMGNLGAEVSRLLRKRIEIA